jgi:teichuronic acid biosynthesis glycosyltransferase TuaC
VEPNRGLRLLVLSTLLPRSECDWAGIFVARQLAGLAALQLQITVFVPRPWPPRTQRWQFREASTASWRREAFPGLSVVSFDYLRPPGRHGISVGSRSMLHAARRPAMRLHGASPFQAVFARFFMPEGYVAFRLGQELGIPSIAYGAGSDVNVARHADFFARRDFRLVARGLDAAVAAGRGVAEQIEAERGAEVPVIHGVVDTQEFAPAGQPHERELLRAQWGMPEGGLVVLYVGAYKEAKGLADLLHAFGALLEFRSDAHLLLFGSGPYRDALVGRVDALGLGGRVKVGHALRPSAVSSVMRAADAFVLPSWREGMPNAVMEAMASGLPVIATDVGGIAAALSTCRGVRIVPSRDTGALTEALKELCASGSLREEMAQAARRWAVDHFDVSMSTAKLKRVIEDVVRHVPK